jgi:transcriptional regulator with XRE-family HTH domain
MKPNISKILKQLRKNHNKTQKELAEYIGISRQAYSRYESNLREPSMEILSKIATYYDVSPQVFFINDVDKLLDADMDIVELVARYQLKKIIYADENVEENSGLDQYIRKQDKEQVNEALSEYFGLQEVSKKKKSTPLKRRIIKYGFLTLILLFMVNIGMMTLHNLDSGYQYQILNYSYINAVLPDQNVNATMYLGIVRIREFNPETIEVGDSIVIYSDFGLNEYFIEEVVSIDYDNQTVTTTYDDATSITNKFIDVYGEYQQDANLLGTIYYSSKFATGYGFLVLGHVILLAMYYLSFIDVKDK